MDEKGGGGVDMAGQGWSSLAATSMTQPRFSVARPAFDSLAGCEEMLGWSLFKSGITLDQRGGDSRP